MTTPHDPSPHDDATPSRAERDALDLAWALEQVEGGGAGEDGDEFIEWRRPDADSY
jgi:2-polyprenyl-6-methoxyphenol hydroxylase-like FAD-dependent oxidoreductase